SVVVAVITLAFVSYLKVSTDSLATREFRQARDAGDASFSEGNYLAAVENYEKALVRRDDDDTRLGRARALCSLAKDWERKSASEPPERLPQLEKRFGNFAAVYEL